MAKTDWHANDTVMPADLNQIGQEINEVSSEMIRTAKMYEPCDVSTANITSGLYDIGQDINGVIVQAGMRVFVQGGPSRPLHQRSHVGIYVASEGAWERASDMPEGHVVYKGELIPVLGGKYQGIYTVLHTGEIGVLEHPLVTDSPLQLVSKTDVGLSNVNNVQQAPLTHVGSGGTEHAVATTSVAGFMSAEDKGKLVVLDNEMLDARQPEVGGSYSTLGARLNALDTKSAGWRIYNDIRELGLTPGSETIEEICEMMADKSVLYFQKVTANVSTAYPANAGILTVTRLSTARTALQFARRSSINSTKIWIGFYDAITPPSFTGWQEVITDKGGTINGNLSVNNIYLTGSTTSRILNSTTAGRDSFGLWANPVFEKGGAINIYGDTDPNAPGRISFFTSGIVRGHFYPDGRFTVTGQLYVGTGAPNGNVTAPVGAIYQRTDGGSSTTLYIKESGTGNTGWRAV